MWQKAVFLKPTTSPEPFWVRAEPPVPNRFPPLNESADGFEKESVEGLWYKTNVVEPGGRFFMWASQNSVELLHEFLPDVQPDTRYLKGSE